MQNAKLQFKISKLDGKNGCGKKKVRLDGQ